MSALEPADQAALDKAYNARGSVPDFDVYARGFVENSARARKTLKVVRDIAYGAHKDEVLDVFPAGPKAPVHVFIHGGYWRMLTKEENSFVAEGLAPAGACTVVNTYSLLPGTSMDAIVRQCRATIAWAYRHIAEHGGDPNRIHISGHSAGGHLTAMMLATDWAGEYGLPADLVKGATCLSGVYDLRPLTRAFTREWLQLSADQAFRNSPILHMPKHKCPVVMSVGGAEPDGFQAQHRAYKAALEAHGVTVTDVPAPGDDHFALGNRLMDRKHPLTQAMLKQMGLS